MILYRYITRRILQPLFGSLAFLLALYLAWAATDLIGAGGAAAMTASEFLRLISMQAVTVLDLLLPVSLFLAVVSGLGQMVMSQESVAIRAAGAGEAMIMSSVLVIALIFALLIATLTLSARAPLFENIYELRQSINDDNDLRRIQSGEFYLSRDSDLNEQGEPENSRVVFADRSDGDRLYDVFVARNMNGMDEFIFAASALQQFDDSGRQVIIFDDGYLYRLQKQAGMSEDWHLRFGELKLIMAKNPISGVTSRRKSMHLSQLAASDDPYMVAELQRRFAAPLSAFLLALLAVPLSRSAPRKSRYGRLIVAGIIMIVFFNVDSLARSWVEQALVAPFPGVFWPHMLIAAVLIGWYWPSRSRPPSPGSKSA